MRTVNTNFDVSLRAENRNSLGGNMMRQQSLIRGLWLVALSLVIGVGCAGDQEDINLVQPGYVKKSDLLGKSWYYLSLIHISEPTRPY